MLSACRPRRRGLVGGISAIPASHIRSRRPGAGFAPGPNRAISAISATRFGRRPSARRDSSTAARGNATRRSRDRAGSAWLARNCGAGASRPKATDMGPNLSASVGRDTPQHCSVLSSAMRGLAADQGLWGPGLFAPRYIVSVGPEQRVTAVHALSPQPPPSHAGLSHMRFAVVSTKARRAARRDLLSTIGRLSLREGLSAPRFALRSRRRKRLCGLPPPCPPPYDGGGEDSE